MKKKYNLSLDKEKIDIIKVFIEPKGITLSGYVNSIVNENVKAIEVLQGVNSLKDLTIGKLTELYSGMVEEIDKNKKGKKK